jgi:hypothetical protein
MAPRFVLFVWLACSVSSLIAADPENPADKPPPGSPKAIEPADVYVRVTLLRSEIDLIRSQLGKPANIQPPIQILNAAPREVFYQAVTLFRKVDRLSFELTRQSASIPQTPAESILPYHVREVIDQTIVRVKFMKEKLGIKSVADAKTRDPTITSTEVFQSIVQANRQVNLLLRKQLSPSDIYRQITLAVGYTARLRAIFPGRRIPQIPDPEPDRTLPGVHQVLMQSFQIVRAIAKASDIKILELRDALHENVTLSDTYDIASLLVSELAFLHKQLEGMKPPRPVVYPGPKTPSQVYQRAMLLQVQLNELRHWVDQTPLWLTKQNP